MPKGTECVAQEPLLLVLFSADPFAVGNLTPLQRHTECWVRHYFDNKREQKIKKKKKKVLLIPEEFAPVLPVGFRDRHRKTLSSLTIRGN